MSRVEALVTEAWTTRWKSPAQRGPVPGCCFVWVLRWRAQAIASPGCLLFTGPTCVFHAIVITGIAGT